MSILSLLKKEYKKKRKCKNSVLLSVCAEGCALVVVSLELCVY